MYKFYVKVGAITREVTPYNAEKLALVTDKEQGRIFYRKKLNGSPMFKGDDYKWFNALEHSYSRCSTVTFEIHKKCSGIYILDWTGEFGMSDGKWSPDKGTVEFTIKAIDEYTDVIKNSKIKVNILDIKDLVTVDADIVGYDFEFVDCSGVTNGTTGATERIIEGCSIAGPISEDLEIDPETTSKLSFSLFNDDCSYETDQGWIPYFVRLYQGYESDPYFVHPFEIRYAREYKETVDVDGLPVEPPGSGWINLGPIIVNGLNYTRWARIPFGLDVADVNYVWDIIACDNITAKVNFGATSTDTFSRNRSWNQVMEYITETSFGKGVISDFFSLNGDSTHPVNDEYTKALANLDQLLIAQKSDIIDPYSSEPAWKGEMTFEDLQNIWRIIFNCEWVVDGDNIRVEHKSYFAAQGLIDLTAAEYQKYSKNNNSYEYLKETTPLREEFAFMDESINADFLGLPIEYDNICANQDPESNVMSYSVNVTTDISYIRVKRDIINPEGFVLICRDGATVKNEAGLISGITFANNHLSWANLHYNYHRWDRALDSGNMNGAITPFFSSVQTKKQIGIRLPMCCLVLNPYTAIKTFIGTGSIYTIEENLYEGSAKIEVIHSIGELTGSFEDRQFDDSFDLSFN